jgi:ubiquinone/menaquinone biosynthesis C-methylase UbiE
MRSTARDATVLNTVRRVTREDAVPALNPSPRMSESRSTSTRDDSGYLLGSSTPEVERLIAQAQLFEREVEWLLAEIRPRPGTAAIDVGCGPVGILPALVRHLGPTSRVVGVDSDPTMADHAIATCRSQQLDNVEVRIDDASAIGLPADSFDLAHARLLLINVANPIEVLCELVRLTRPGGTVAVQEIDWVTWQCEPPHPAWVALRDLLHQLWASRGFDPYLGRRLPRMLAASGLTDVQAMVHAGVDDRTQPYQRLIVEFATRFTPQLASLGLATAQEVASLSGQLSEHLDDPGTIVVRAMNVQAWGRVPG